LSAPATWAISAAPRRWARIAGAFYLITFVAGIFALMVGGSRGAAAGLLAGVSYVAVTLLLYFILKPVNPGLSLLAALASLAGCAVGPISMALKLSIPAQNVSLVLFGCYCLLVGYLILRSTFLPRFVGGLMVFAGLGWLTFLWPPLAAALQPWVFGPGIIGEGTLTLWLLAVGLNEQSWIDQRSKAP
jgi:hypothetical protein